MFFEKMKFHKYFQGGFTKNRNNHSTMGVLKRRADITKNHPPIVFLTVCRCYNIFGFISVKLEIHGPKTVSLIQIYLFREKLLS